MKFAFELCQRVIVPNSNGVQGVITSANASVGRENEYVVVAMTDEAKIGSVGYGEAVLLAAQPKPEATKGKR